MASFASGDLLKEFVSKLQTSMKNRLMGAGGTSTQTSGTSSARTTGTSSARRTGSGTRKDKEEESAWDRYVREQQEAAQKNVQEQEKDRNGWVAGTVGSLSGGNKGAAAGAATPAGVNQGARTTATPAGRTAEDDDVQTYLEMLQADKRDQKGTLAGSATGTNGRAAGSTAAGTVGSLSTGTGLAAGAAGNAGTKTGNPGIVGSTVGTLEDEEKNDWDDIGQYGAGNIDLYNRKTYTQPDGSISTVNSMSFFDEYTGKEVLIPTIINGRQVEDHEAIEYYYNTGEYLGRFDTPEEADEYAERLHRQQERLYTQNGTTSGTTAGTTPERGWGASRANIIREDGANPWSYDGSEVYENETYGNLKAQGKGGSWFDFGKYLDRDYMKNLDPETYLHSMTYREANRNSGLWDNEPNATIDMLSDTKRQELLEYNQGKVNELDEILNGNDVSGLQIPEDAEMDAADQGRYGNMQEYVEDRAERLMFGIRERDQIPASGNGEPVSLGEGGYNDDPEMIGKAMYRYLYGENSLQRELQENGGNLSADSQAAMMRILNSQRNRSDNELTRDLYQNKADTVQGYIDSENAYRETLDTGRRYLSGEMTAEAPANQWWDVFNLKDDGQNKAQQIYNFFTPGTAENYLYAENAGDYTGDKGDAGRVFDHAYYYLPEEKRIFMDLMDNGKVNEALAFHQGMVDSGILNYRYMNREEDVWTMQSDIAPVSMGAATVATKALEPVYGAINMIDRATGDKSVDDPYSWRNAVTNFNQTVRGNIMGNAQQAATQLTGNAVVGKYAGAAVGGLFSALDNIRQFAVGKVGAGLLQGAGMIAQGAEAWQNTAQAITLGQMFGEVFEDTRVQELKEHGDGDRAIVSGLLNAGQEVFWETLGGIDVPFTEGMSSVKYGLATYLGELTEEVGGTVSDFILEPLKNNIYDYLTTGKADGKSQIDTDAMELVLANEKEYARQDGSVDWGKAYKDAWANKGKELVEVAFSTAVSTLPMSMGTGSDMTRRYKETGTNLQANGQTADFVNLAMETTEDAETRARLEKIKGKLDAGKRISKRELGSIFTAVTAETNDRVAQLGTQILQSNVRDYLRENYGESVDPRAQRELSEIITRAVNEGEKALSFRERSMLQQYPAAMDLMRDMTSDEAVDPMKRSAELMENTEKETEEKTSGLRETGKQLREMTENPMAKALKSVRDSMVQAGERASLSVKSAVERVAADEEVQQAVAQVLEARRRKSAGETAGTGSQTGDVSGNYQAEITQEEAEEARRETLVFDDGEGNIQGGRIVGMKDRSFIVETADGQQRTVDSAVARAADEVTAAVMNYIESSDMDDQMATELLEASKDRRVTPSTVEALMNGARNVFIRGYMGSNFPEKIGFDAEVARGLYQRGQAAAAAEETVRQEKVQSNQAAGRVLRPGEGTVEHRGFDVKDLDGTTRKQVETAGEMAKRIGYKLIIENDTKNSNRFGEYDPTTGSVILNIAGKEANGNSHHLLVAMSHEVTHLLENNSPEMYKQLRQFVFDEIRRNGGNLEQRIGQKMDNYNYQIAKMRQNGENVENITVGGAVAEVVADACDQVLGNEKLIQKLAGENPTLFQRIKGYVTDFVRRVKDAAKGMRQSGSIDSSYMRDVDKLAEKWGVALEEATSRNRATETSGAENETTKGQYSFAGEDPQTGMSVYVSNFAEGTSKANKANRIIGLVQNVFSKKPIPLTVYENGQQKSFVAQFDPDYDPTGIRKTDVGKLAYGLKRGSKGEIRVAMNLADDYVQILEESTYASKEGEKAGKIHPGVNQWHYFVDDIYYIARGADTAEPYEITVNVKETAAGNFVYSYSAERIENLDTKKVSELGIGPVNNAGKPAQSSLISNRMIAEGGRENNIQSGKNSQMSLAEMDQAYMDAVEGGDEATARELMEDAARNAGYTLKVYHGTPTGGFTQFRDWSYFTENKAYADRYQTPSASSIRGRYEEGTRQTYELLMNPGRVFDTRKARERNIYNQARMEYGMGALTETDSGLPDWTNGRDLIDYIEENDLPYDTIILDEGADGGYGEEVVKRGISYVSRSTQVKSAETITRDDSGNVIPLNERFNPEKKDIRYSLAEVSEIQEKQAELNTLRSDVKEIESSEEYQQALEAGMRGDFEPYNAMLEKTGLPDKKRRLDALQKEIQEWQKEWNDQYDREQREKKAAAIQKSGLQPEEYRRKAAVKEFGYTTDYREAGYLLPNGKMLNFSGEKGRHYGSRGQDHRAISTIYDAENMTGSEAMVAFMSEGNIRCMPETPGMDIGTTTEPTREQYNAIRNIVNQYGRDGYFAIDLTDAEGQVTGTLEYEGRVSADRVLNDLKIFFKTGEIPQQSGLSKFFSLQDSTPAAGEWIMGIDPDELMLTSEKKMVRNYQKIFREVQEIQEKIRGMKEQLKEAKGDEARKLRINLQTEDAKLQRRQEKLNEITGSKLFGGLLRNAQETIDTFLSGKTQEQVNQAADKMREKAAEARRTAEEAAKVLERIADREEQTVLRRYFDPNQLRNTAARLNEYFGMTDQQRMEDGLAEIGLKILSGDTSFEESLNRLANRVLQETMGQGGVFFGEDGSSNMGDLFAEQRADIYARILQAVHEINPSVPGVENGNRAEIRNLMQYVSQVSDMTRQAARGMRTVATMAEGLMAETANTKQATDKMRRQLRTAVNYFDMVNQKADATATAEQIEQITRRIESQAARRILEEQNKWAHRLENDRNMRRLSQENMATRRKINTAYNRMVKLILNESDLQNVPESLKPVARAAIRMVLQNDASGNRKVTGVAYADLLRSRQTLEAIDRRDGTALNLDSLIDEGDIDGGDDVAVAIEEALKDIEDGLAFWNSGNGRTAVTLEGDKAALEKVQQGMSQIYDIVTAARRVFLDGKMVETADAAYEVDTEARKKEVYQEYVGGLGKAVKGLHKNVVLGNMTPEYFFKNLKNNGLSRIYNEFRKAEDRYGKILNEAKGKIETLAEEKGYGSWDVATKQEIKFEKGGTAEMTLEQLMSLYATWKRENTLGPEMSQHLTKGGFVIQAESKKKVFGRESQMMKPIRVTAGDMARIEGMLTEEQRAYVDGMVQILSRDMGKYGNEASRRMHGIDKYKESYYFPFSVWDGVKNKESNTGGAVNPTNNNRAAHQSFTNRRKSGAANAVMIRDFSTVCAEHINQMATYATFGSSIEGMNRVLNFRVMEDLEHGQEDAVQRNVETILRERYGNNVVNYLRDFMADLNGGAVQKGSGLGQSLMSMFKKNAVGGSLSVSLQQPLSYIRASTMISTKHLSRASARCLSRTASPDFWRNTYNEMLEHSGVAVIKDMGRFDMNFSQGAVNWLQPDAKTGRARAVYQKIEDVTNALPEKMDQITWTKMWEAIKIEQQEANPGMDVKSEEFLDKVGERFNEVMRRTQVYDSVLVKSQLMRKQDWFSKSITAFRAEPTLSLNLFMDAISNWKTEGGKKNAAAVAVTFLLGAIAQAAVKGIMSAGRSPDEKKTLAENFAYRFGSSFISEANPLSLIPGYDNIVDALSGNDINDNAWGMIKTFGNSLGRVWNPPTGEDLTADSGYRYIEDTIGQLTQMFTGVPAKNLMRDSRAVYNWFMGSYAGRETEASVLKYQAIDQLTSSDMMAVISKTFGKEMWSSSNTAYANRIYQAERDGRDAEAEEMRAYLMAAKGKDEKAVDSAVTSAAKKDESLSVKERAEFILDNGYADKATWIDSQYKEGNLSQADVKALYGKYFPGKDPNDVFWKEVKGRYESGEITEKEAREEYKKYHPNATEKEAGNYFWGLVKDQYKDGSITRKEAEKKYKEYYPSASADDMWQAFDELDYTKETGKTPSGAYYRLHDAIEANNTTAINKAVKTLMEHGRKKNGFKSSIEPRWKDVYNGMRNGSSEKVKLRDGIEKAMRAAGYSEKEIEKMFTNWAKDKGK